MSSTTRLSLKPRTGPVLRNKPNSTRRRRTFGNPFTALRRMINNRTSSKNNNNKIFLSDESGNSKKNPVFEGVVVRNGGRKNRTKKRR